jgi:hypothetical protein
LLAQGEVLESDLAMTADDEGKEPEQVKYESDHERRLWPDGAGESITCRADRVLAKHRLVRPRWPVVRGPYLDPDWRRDVAVLIEEREDPVI